MNTVAVDWPKQPHPFGCPCGCSYNVVTINIPGEVFDVPREFGLAVAFEVPRGDVERVRRLPNRYVEPQRATSCECLSVGCDGSPALCPIAPTTRCVYCGSRDPSAWPACASCQRGSEQRPVTAERIVERLGWDPRPNWRR